MEKALIPGKKALLTGLLGSGCTSAPVLDDIRVEQNVDLQRFMGDWYVVSSIPTFIEKQAFNAVERYDQAKDGTIRTTFSFNRGGLDGERKVYRPTGFVREGTGNAIWAMCFVWPIKADYRIVYINDDYTQTIVGRNKRDYVWIMSRTPGLSPAEYFRLVKIVREQGYDTRKLREVPHAWPESEEVVSSFRR